MIRNRSTSSGFTLIELIVAVALLLVIMLGVNQVFRTTSETISTATAVQDGVRSLRGLQSQMFADVLGVDGDPNTGIVEAKNLPALVIRAESQRLPLNKAEEQDTTATLREYRKDILSFFSRGSFKRRTGDGVNVYIGEETSKEAWIWYGHLKQPNRALNSAADTYNINEFRRPGEGAINTNPFNYYPADWVLGRTAVLMVGTPNTDPVLGPNNYWPRCERANAEPVYQSKCDLALVSMGDRNASKGYYRQLKERSDPADATYYDNLWWARLSEEMSGTTSQGAYRFHGSRFVPKALGSDNIALTVPAVVPGCTQFIVEFAGDYDNIKGIDTWTIGTGPSQRSGIRWYGMWRKTSLDPNQATVWTREDVWPVSTALADLGQPFAGPLPFERGTVPTQPSVSNPPTTSQYTCVWGPMEMNTVASSTLKIGAPMLIRVTLRTIDPNVRLGDGLVHEYVFAVK